MYQFKMILALMIQVRIIRDYRAKKNTCFSLVINGKQNTLLSWQTESEESEHKGLTNLIKGVFGMFRNTTVHAPRITWTINEQDALNCLTLVSLIHRTLDRCVRTRY